MAEKASTFLAGVLADGYRERVKLATKLPACIVEKRQEMDRFLNAQLRKLNTSRIDYYLVHGLNGDIWDRMQGLGVTEFLDHAKATGRIVNAGFSFHGLLPDFKRIVDAYPWQFCQIQYNFLDEQHQAGTEGLQYAAAKGLGVIVMQPLRGGTLGRLTPPPAIEAIWSESETPRTPAEWALRWVWNHPEVTVVLSGMNDDAQVEENLAIAGHAYPHSLTEAELALIGKAGRKYREIMKVGCTGCGYCEPCPMGVGIAASFDTYNHLHMFGNPGETQTVYVVRLSGVISGSARLCLAVRTLWRLRREVPAGSGDSGPAGKSRRRTGRRRDAAKRSYGSPVLYRSGDRIRVETLLGSWSTPCADPLSVCFWRLHSGRNRLPFRPR